jgi:hypothetical protein
MTVLYVSATVTVSLAPTDLAPDFMCAAGQGFSGWKHIFLNVHASSHPTIN